MLFLRSFLYCPQWRERDHKQLYKCKSCGHRFSGGERRDYLRLAINAETTNELMTTKLIFIVLPVFAQAVFYGNIAITVKINFCSSYFKWYKDSNKQ